MGVAVHWSQTTRHLRTIRRLFPPLFAAAILAVFTLLLFYRLLFTDRVLASGDILHYFYPYRDYAAAALRAGRVPLWNPYIFMGAPFLANPQAAALYPLHWPLSWLPVTKQLYWSGAIHAWILAVGGYALMRRWGTGWLAAVSCGLVLAGSGHYGGLLGHINQMNGAAWLPWLLWAAGETGVWRGKRENGRPCAQHDAFPVVRAFVAVIFPVRRAHPCSLDTRKLPISIYSAWARGCLCDARWRGRWACAA